MIFIPQRRNDPTWSGTIVSARFDGDTIEVQDVKIELPRDARIAVLKEDLTLRPIYLTRDELKTLDSFKFLHHIQATDVFKRKIEPVLEEEVWDRSK